MRLRLIAVSAIALLAACTKAPGAGDSGQASDSAPAAAVSDASSDAQAQAALPSIASKPAPMQAPDFVAAAAASDMFEIKAAKIAQKRATNPDVKAFAMMMVEDHTKSTAKIKAAIAKSGQGAGMPIPKALPDDKTAMIAALNAAPAGDFDKTYMQQQLDAHQAALNLMTGYAKDGDVPALKQAAAEITPVVQMHLDKVKTIQIALGK